MTSIVSLLAFVLLSAVVLRIGATALRLTGVSRDLARFQAHSSFFLAGFTTRESEYVVNHPVRRRIIMALMCAGYIGVGTLVSTAVVSFVSTSDNNSWPDSGWFRLGFIIVGLLGLWLFLRTKVVNFVLEYVITWVLRRFTDLHVLDYARLLHVSHDYIIAEIRVSKEDWFEGRSLAELRLNKRELLVLGIERADSSYEGTPGGDTVLCAGDTMVVYGLRQIISELKGPEKQ
jgi:hypothetical protein